MDKNLIPKLRFHRVLEGLQDSELEYVSSFAIACQLTAGEILFQPGDSVDALYLVMQGRLRVVGDLKFAPGRTLRLIGPGEHFGALGILINHPLPLTVTADQPTSMLRITREDLSVLIEEYPRIRDNLSYSLGTTLRSSLLEQTPSRMPRFVAWVHFSQAGRDVVGRIATRLTELDESVAVLTDQPDRYVSTAASVKSLKRDGRHLVADETAELLRDVSTMDRVLIDVDGRAAAKELEYLVDSCDVCFWLARDGDVQQATSFLKRTLRQSPVRRDKMRFVCLPNESEQIALSIDLYREMVDGEFKVPVRRDGQYDRLQRHGVERIVHHLRDVRLGIALGGGAARGMAHLGVLDVLESAGIFFDMISGTSAGALTGVQYCAGYDAPYCVDRFEHDLTPNRLFRMLPKGDAWYLLTKYRTRAWDRMLVDYLHEWTLEQLLIPFKGVSVDLIAGQQVIHEDDESAIRTICESINLPGISAPLCRDGMALIDGGTLNVLPADVLVQNGCDYVVAVNVSSRIKHEFGGNRPDTPTEKMRVPGIRATLARERVVQDRSMNAIGARPADFVIEPDISGFALTDFAKTRQIAEMGKVAAEASVDALRESLSQIDEKLFAEI